MNGASQKAWHQKAWHEKAWHEKAWHESKHTAQQKALHRILPFCLLMRECLTPPAKKSAANSTIRGAPVFTGLGVERATVPRCALLSHYFFMRSFTGSLTFSVLSNSTLTISSPTFSTLRK